MLFIFFVALAHRYYSKLFYGKTVITRYAIIRNNRISIYLSEIFLKIVNFNGLNLPFGLVGLTINSDQHIKLCIQSHLYQEESIRFFKFRFDTYQVLTDVHG